MRADTNSESATSRSRSRSRFCDYLRTERTAAELSLDDIARVTRIPRPSLERIEEGRFEELPADVFVRGFLRSYAQVVGLDADQVVRDYARCGLTPAPVSSELADELLASAADCADVGEAVVVTQAPADDGDDEVVVDDDDDADVTHAASQACAGERRRGRASTVRPVPARRRLARGTARQNGGSARRRASGRSSSADRHRTTEASPLPQRAGADVGGEKKPTTDAHRPRIFLPPALSESDVPHRRGPLTLAVLILVIVATLTMSYLLRHPSASDDGYTATPSSSSSVRA